MRVRVRVIGKNVTAVRDIPRVWDLGLKASGKWDSGVGLGV